MKHRWIKLGMAVAITALLAACGDGTDGVDGAPGTPADPAITDSLQAQIDALTEASASPESCAVCHNGDAFPNGDSHQAAYDELYQDGVMTVSNMGFSAAAGVATLTFELTKNGADFDCTKSTSSTTSDFSIGSYWAEYDPVGGTFPSDMSISTSKAWDSATNVCTFTKTGLTVEQVAAMNANGFVMVYGTDEVVSRNSAKHITTGKFPFAGVFKIGTMDYSSAANVSGCENCHTVPFLKHTYIYGTVNDQFAAPTEFYTCKGCHYDERNGGHIDWQILKDDPARYAALGTTPATDAEKIKYAYKAKLMNDVHMSHAMEFGYPQSMYNCVTCHAGKLDKALADDQFKAETCISCHSVDGIKAKMAAANYNHSVYIATDADLRATTCTTCHTGAIAFSKLHGGGYDPKIYTTTGVRYATNFPVTIDSASFDAATNLLTMNFSASEVADVAGLAVTDIVPTVMVGLYGYDSKDFIVAAHGRDSANKRLLEFKLGDTNPRFTVVSAAGGSWEIVADLTMWADKLADGSVKRAEIAVMPELKNADGTVLGLNAPSKTFNFADGDFEDFFSPIVKVAGCNTCHDQLATTFHSGIRGGNIVVCRICHEVSSRGSHLELQSRSIDSYVHAIHSFQPFDVGDVDATDPVAMMRLKHHVESDFPRFGTDCMSCHNEGTFNVPDQSKSMPGVLSGADTTSFDRTIGAYPQQVSGPAVRACGACHRSEMLNADDAAGDGGGLAALQGHFKTFGYLIDDADGVWDLIVAKVMSLF